MLRKESPITATMCTVYDEYATCGKHRTVLDAKFEYCKKSNGGKVNCQTLKRKKMIGSKVCTHGKNGKSCTVM
jgi:hypothetical protein